MSLSIEERRANNAAAQRRRYARLTPTQKAAERRHHVAWRKAHPEKYRASRDAIAERNRAVVVAAKRTGCIKCGEDDPRCLDFHHRDPSIKEFRISAAPKKHVSLARLKAEIAKCDVVCCNCHAKEHRGLL